MYSTDGWFDVHCILKFPVVRWNCYKLEQRVT